MVASPRSQPPSRWCHLAQCLVRCNAMHSVPPWQLLTRLWTDFVCFSPRWVLDLHQGPVGRGTASPSRFPHVLFPSSLFRPVCQVGAGFMKSHCRFGCLASSLTGHLGMPFLCFCPLFPCSLFLIFFFFPEADAVISTQSAWPHSPALGSVTHGNEREAGDRTPHTHILSRPRPSLALAV